MPKKETSVSVPAQEKPIKSLPYRKEMIPELRKMKRALGLFPSGWQDLAWHLYKEDCRKAGMSVKNLKRTTFNLKQEGQKRSIMQTYLNKAKRSLQFNYSNGGKYLGNQYTEKTIAYIHKYILVKEHSTLRKKERIQNTLDKFFKY